VLGAVFAITTFAFAHGVANAGRTITDALIADEQTVTLSAGTTQFEFIASPNARTNGPGLCFLTDGSITNASPNTGYADDFAALGQSTATRGLTASAEGIASISLTDLPFPGDYEFQDLDVLLQNLSEPNALVILSIAIVGLLAARKWCLA
jgi:hypothetical protein